MTSHARRRLHACYICLVVLLAAGLQPAASRRQAGPAEYAVVIMIDGLRPDALRKARAPNLKKLEADGTTFLQAQTIYPSQTRVAFVSLPTGAYPGSHGIIGGDDFKDGDWKTVSFGVDGPGEAQALCARPTFFEEMTAAGKTSAYVALKGYELVGAKGATWTINGARIVDPVSWRYRYTREVEGSTTLAQWHKQRLTRQLFDQTLALVKDHRPNLLVVNLGSTDYSAHTYGPDSPEYLQTIEFTDGLVGELMKALEAAGTLSRTAFVVSADHGFTHIGSKVIVQPVGSGPEIHVPELTAKQVVHFATNTGGTSMGLYLRDKTQLPEALRILRAQSWTESVYCGQMREGCDRSLADLHAYFPGRSPDIMVDLDDDASMTARGGNHGTLRENDMRIPLFFSGAGVARGVVMGKAELIDVAPTLLRILGVNKGILRPDGKVLTAALAN